MDVIVQLSDEGLLTPWAQVPTCAADALGWYPAACRGGDVHGLVEEGDAGFGVAEAEAGQGEIGGADAALNRVAWAGEAGQRASEQVVGSVRLAVVEGA